MLVQCGSIYTRRKPSQGSVYQHCDILLSGSHLLIYILLLYGFVLISWNLKSISYGSVIFVPSLQLENLTHFKVKFSSYFSLETKIRCLDFFLINKHLGVWLVEEQQLLFGNWHFPPFW